jgi:hypothetical protein
MKIRLYLISGIVLSWLLATGCGRSEPTISGDEVVVQTDKLDVHFARLKPFSGSYLIFGGANLSPSMAFFDIALGGLDIGTARSIHTRYPDFDRCSSPGAPIAQKALSQLDIVSRNAVIAGTLKKALALHKKTTHTVDDNVCVQLSGHVLQLRSVIVRESGEEIVDKLPSQARHDYFLVENAELSTFRELLTAGL